MHTLQGVIPAVRKLKGFEAALQSSYEWIIVLEIRLSQLRGMVQYVKQANKKILLHIDLVQGLKADEYGLEFLIHDLKIDGIVSTRGNVVGLAKKRGVLAVQRVFLLDSLSLQTEDRILEKYSPDYIEVLPGKLPEVILEMKKKTSIPIIAGGLIQDEADVEAAYEAGAVAISTSEKSLWE